MAAQQAAKGAKPKDKRPCRLRKPMYGKARRMRTRKAKGNRRQAQHRAMEMLEQRRDKLWPAIYRSIPGVTRGAFGRLSRPDDASAEEGMV